MKMTFVEPEVEVITFTAEPVMDTWGPTSNEVGPSI